ncbi:MAG: efflux RND transporter periplasmic adaptor subunit, partial [Planctomycetaceae bacterium]|nr:efflux RND transporter periplasmic adaptor subunit [Planctomycetaceae bacterium]
PLRDRRGVMQASLVILSDTAVLDCSAEQFLKAAAQPLASTLSLAKKSQPSWVGRCASQIAEGIRSRKFIAALVGLAMVACLLLIPMPYRIACECELEPVTRRFVAAPFDGKLERTEVEPGDLVNEGQLLAVMDGREIRWELAGLQAEQSQAGKERDGHMAKHDFGAAQVAKLEMERLKVREQLLSKRSEKLDIRSPIDGLVVMGDLKKSEGVPLRVGERLFEIAPLEQMVVEVAIPESDIAWAKDDQTVEIVLDAYPETTWTGALARIHPRSEIREDKHVFIGEVVLDNPDAVLRPGMRGRAKITGPSKSLGWNWFHKPWYELRYWLGW